MDAMLKSGLAIDREPQAAQRRAAPAGRSGGRFYLPEADGIRCIAVLLVWFHHYPPGPRIFLRQLSAGGWIGVNVFLVLSSFLITSLLILEYDAKGAISLSRFYSRRVLRIWPLLALALGLNYVLLPAINYFPGGFSNPIFLGDVKHHAIPNALLLGNWSVAVYSYLDYGFCSHLWTINLEEQFYMLWPVLMVYLVLRSGRIVGCCLGMILVSYLARFYFVSVGFPHPALWVSTITRLDPLAWGAILAVAYPAIKKSVEARSPAVSAAIAAAVFGLAVASVAFTLRRWVWTGDVWWKLGVADIFVALSVAAVLSSRALALVFRLPVIAWLGKISYGLYVYHKFFVDSRASAAVRAFALQATGGHAGLLPWLVGMSINAIALVAVSAASYYLFERFFLKFKERFETVLSRPA